MSDNILGVDKDYYQLINSLEAVRVLKHRATLEDTPVNYLMYLGLEILMERFAALIKDPA